MVVIEFIDELQAKLEAFRQSGMTIGLVPTMGALHAGHISLVTTCKQHCNITVVSIFVNPTQFNNPDDLEKYPRTLENDLDMLDNAGVDIVFYPSVEEMYPETDNRKFIFGEIEQVMEGKFRPGHFNGVAQIVSKLFDAVMPDKAFFGEKDFQQLAIIKKMVIDYNYPIDVVACPIVREADGLALSSRNMRLTPVQREHAVLISRTLFESVQQKELKSVLEVKKWVEETINSDSELKVEYFDIVNSISLQSVNCWGKPKETVGCIAVFAGEIRLIDNIMY
jgi:pantoate--beta-alanine ligase